MPKLWCVFCSFALVPPILDSSRIGGSCARSIFTRPVASPVAPVGTARLRGGGSSEKVFDSEDFPSFHTVRDELLRSAGNEREASDYREEVEPETGDRNDVEASRTACSSWDMVDGFGEERWVGKQYIILRNTIHGTAIEMLTDASGFTLLFNLQVPPECVLFRRLISLAFVRGVRNPRDTANLAHVYPKHDGWLTCPRLSN